MDNFEMTKIAGAVLAALLLMFGFKTIVEMRTSEHGAVKDGYALSAPEAKPEATKPAEKAAEAQPADKAAAKPADKTAEAKPGDTAKPAAAPAKDAAPAPAAAAGGDDITPLLTKASADNGKAQFSKCKSCHVAEKGKSPTVGPNLWGVVNRPKGSYPGFAYSAGMKEKGGNWTFADLSKFLTNPKAFVSGTKMVFNGIEAASDRADVIAYLGTLADTPVPMPK